MKHKSGKKSMKFKKSNIRMLAAMKKKKKMKEMGSARRVVTMGKGGNLQVQAKNASDAMVARLNKRRRDRFKRNSGVKRNRKDAR